MIDDLNFSISTDGLIEKGKEIEKDVNIIKEALNDINNARTSLDGWVSVNKDKFDNRIANVLPKMNEMAEVIESYSKVAIQTSQQASNVEDKIASAIDNEFLA